MGAWAAPLVIGALAFAPGLFWLWYFYKKDKLEPEPLTLIRKCFLWGMAVVIPVAAIEQLLTSSYIVGLLILAPIMEELAKFLPVRLAVYPIAEFDEPMDGVVYAAAVALGFASVENIFYLYAEYQKSYGSLATIMILRAFLSVPGHALFSIMWGYALGVAKFMVDRDRARKVVVAGMLSAMGMHALFNSLTQLGPFWMGGMLVLVPIMWRLVNRRIGQAIHDSPYGMGKEQGGQDKPGGQDEIS
jgi:RsiW-degrading membrane proteinase PrsW (M82 family)